MMQTAVKMQTPFPKTPSEELVASLLAGSVDMHVHVPPEVGVTRRFDALQTIQEASKYGMRAVVLKNQNSPTAIAAYAINRAMPEGSAEAVGSMVMEYDTTAGLNQYTAMCVEGQAKMGCKMVWFPTFQAYWHCNFTSMKGTGIKLLDENGKLYPACLEVLEVAKQYDMCVGSGHIFYPECAALLEAAKDMGLDKLVVTHPLSAVSRTPYTIEELCHLVDCGAVIEHCWRNCLPQLKSYDPHKYVEAVRELGAENTILSTDFCQVSDPSAAEGLRAFIAVMLQFGCTPEEITAMVKTNPCRLLNLSAR